MSAPPAPHFHGLEEKLHRELPASGVPGLAVGIAVGADTYMNGFGVTNVNEPTPVTPDTLFRIASITKVVTGTAIMRLVDAGELDLNAPVRNYIPDLTLDSPEAAEQLTVRHLVAHTTGWPSGRWKLVHSDEALERLVAGLSDIPRLLPVGEAWSYGNLGPAVAGRIVEVVTGQLFETAMQDLVLDPIGMDRSVFFAEDALSLRTAAPHVLSAEGAAVLLQQRGVRGFPSPNPASGLFSTVRDLIAFARFHLGDGTTAAGERLLSRESLERMRAPHEPSGSIGVTWFREQSGRPGVVGHTGAIAGFLSELIVAPERQFAFVVLTNASPPLDGLFIFRSLAILDSGGPLGLVSWAAREYAAIEEPQVAEVMLPVDELASYAGRYGGWCEVDVGTDGQRLLLRFGAVGAVPPPQTSAALYPGDRIRLLDGPGRGMRGQFIRGKRGRIRHLRLPVLVLQRRCSASS